MLSKRLFRVRTSGLSLLQLTPTLLRDLGQVNESLISGRSWERVSGLLKAWEWKMSVNNPTVGCSAFERGSERSQKTMCTCFPGWGLRV